jgi:hypothetical protein
MGDVVTTSAAETTAGHESTAPPGSRWLALVLLSLAQPMLILDVTVVNMAYPPSACSPE